MSRNRQIFIGVLVVLAFVLQISVLPQLKLFGVQPDLILVLAIVVAVQEGPIPGAIVGFFGGLLQDLASPQVLGVGAFSKAVVAFLAGTMKDFFMTYTILLPVLLVFVLGMMEMSLHQVALVVLGQEQIPPFKITTIVYASLYDVLIVFLLYPVLKRFRFPLKEESLTIAKPGPGPG